MILEENDINAQVSNNAGNYVCNELMYLVNLFLQENNCPTKFLFIHVPTYFDIDKMAAGMSKMIDYLLTG